MADSASPIRALVPAYEQQVDADAPEPPQWDATGKVLDDELKSLGGAIHSVSCTNDLIVTASSQPVVKVWTVAEAKVVESQKLRHGAVGSSCAEVFGNQVAACYEDGGIGMWDLRSGERTQEFDGDILSAFKVKFLADGRRLVSGGPSGSVSFWDMRMGKLLSEIAADGAEKNGTKDEHEVKRQRKDTKPLISGKNGKSASPLYSLATSADGSLLGCGRGSGAVSVMRLEDLQWVGDVQAHHSETASPVRACAFDAASKLLLSGGDDHHMCVLDAATMARRRSGQSARSPQVERFSAHRGWVTSVSCCPDPARRVAVSTSWDGTVKLWDYCTQQSLCTYKEHADSVFASAFAPDGRFFVTAGVDAGIAMYVAKEGAAQPSAPFKNEEGAIVPVTKGE